MIVIKGHLTMTWHTEFRNHSKLCSRANRTRQHWIKPSQVKAGRNMTVFCAHVCSAVAVSAQGPGWH